MIFLVLSAAAIGVIIVIINRKRKRDQACTVDQNSWNEGTSNQHTIKNDMS